MTPAEFTMQQNLNKIEKLASKSHIPFRHKTTINIGVIIVS